MARVTLGEHEPFEVADSDEALLAYYQGEGATIERGVHVVARGPMEFDGEKYLEPVEVEQSDDVPADASGDQVSDGTGEQMTAVEHPADGTWSPEISNDPQE